MHVGADSLEVVDKLPVSCHVLAAAQGQLTQPAKSHAVVLDPTTKHVVAHKPAVCRVKFVIRRGCWSACPAPIGQNGLMEILKHPLPRWFRCCTEAPASQLTGLALLTGRNGLMDVLNMRNPGQPSDDSWMGHQLVDPRWAGQPAGQPAYAAVPLLPRGPGAVQSALWQGPQPGGWLPQQAWGMTVLQAACMHHHARPFALIRHELVLPRHVLQPNTAIHCCLQQGQGALPWPRAAHGAPGPV